MKYNLHFVIYEFVIFAPEIIKAILTKGSSISKPLDFFCEARVSNFNCYKLLKIVWKPFLDTSPGVCLEYSFIWLYAIFKKTNFLQFLCSFLAPLQK